MIFRVLALLALPVLAYFLVRSLNRRFTLTPRQNRLLFFIVAAMLVIGVLVLLGRVPVHFILAPLGAAGAFMLRFLPTLMRLAPFWGMFKSRVASGRPTGAGGAGQSSKIRTEYFEMELDHNTGNMEGQILKGSYAGRLLGDLSLSELLTLYHESSPDADSAQVLEAYLDRHHEDWREQASRQGFGHTDERGSAAGEESSMSRPLALEILGLEEGVDRKAIVAAHRSLMQKLHPDRGGSDYLAQKINAAKDFLLSALD